MMRPPFRLVDSQLSDDVAEALKELYAQRADIVGIAFVAMYRGRRYVVGTAGEATRNPTFTRGMIAALDDELAEMI